MVTWWARPLRDTAQLPHHIHARTTLSHSRRFDFKNAKYSSWLRSLSWDEHDHIICGLSQCLRKSLIHVPWFRISRRPAQTCTVLVPVLYQYRYVHQKHYHTSGWTSRAGSFTLAPRWLGLWRWWCSSTPRSRQYTCDSSTYGQEEEKECR
jgi:hypothetical protein